MVFLMETTQTEAENDVLRETCGFKQGKSFPTVISTRNRAGGLSLWWNDDVHVTVMDRDLHFIDAAVEDEVVGKWRFSGIYGWAEGSDKWRTWDLLGSLRQQWDGPWLCGGDFNQVLSSREKSGGRGVQEAGMTHFSNCLNEVGCQDLGFHGYLFTWENRRTRGGYIEERLDRFIANEKWRSLFPNGRVQHGDRAHSDHRSIVCETRGEEDLEVKWGWSFRFYPMWTQHKDCSSIVERAWNRSSSADVLDKFARCRHDLDNWTRGAFPAFAKQKNKIQRAMRALERRRKTE
ncbi:unnamed protein product [Linum trigynum]|uniref:Endonuclease/exonuclease/phosphatase domain-containing protein n=1 Tax=Linum trigynum TaxID=586398 RepID=A0AAV2ESP4_9ROSI